MKIKPVKTVNKIRQILLRQQREVEAEIKAIEEDDPVLSNLRFLDYRYIRFCFHPLKDRFVLSNSWKDPQWTDVKILRIGLDSDERDLREQVFGRNMIEIEEKSIPQLLIDEVRYPGDGDRDQLLIGSGISPFLCVSSRQLNPLDTG